MNTEQSKYERLWGEFGQYRAVAPGEHWADQFIATAKPTSGSTVIDFGCGTGRGALRIRQLTGATVHALDFTANCLDADVKPWLGEAFTFTQHDITKPIALRADYGFCTDVLEHIPPQDVDAVLRNIGIACRHLYLNISTVDDAMGALIGEPLHLTVEPAVWWHSKLEELGFRIDRSQDHGECVTFYVSAYLNANDIGEMAQINVEEERIRSNIRANLSLNLREIEIFKPQPDQVVYLLAGGPSLADSESEIIEAGRAGTPIVTVNGTYGWLLDRGIKPAAQVMVDGRAFNKRFVDRHVDTCKYLISSQCDHELVKSLPPEQTWLWHSANSDLVKDELEGRSWHPVSGGTTVITRAIVLLAMLGFRKVEIFGLDSCLRDTAHHAYDQPENDSNLVLDVKVGDRTFKCHGWMVLQAEDFQNIIRYVLGVIPDFEMIVHGDGLISHMLDTACKAVTEV